MDASQRYELPPEIARILGTNYDADDIPIPEELRSQDTLPDSLDFGVDEDFDTISLEVTKRRVRELEKSGPGNADTMLPKAGLNTSSIEDYVRNFLAQASLVKTLETFQSEWLEVNAQGNLPATSQFVASIPDALVENRKLHKRISDLEQINANLKIALRRRVTNMSYSEKIETFINQSTGVPTKRRWSFSMIYGA